MQKREIQKKCIQGMLRMEKMPIQERKEKNMIDIVDDYNPTNGDRIREMPDLELAQVIMCPYDINPDICLDEGKSCYECCLEYLQKPAAEEN